MMNVSLRNVLTYVAVVIALAGSAPQADELSKADLYRQVAVSGLLLADCAQTKNAAHRSVEGYSERNSIIRSDMSDGGINKYFAATLIGSAIVTRALPSAYRPAWQYSLIALEAVVVARNKRLGVHLSGNFK